MSKLEARVARLEQVHGAVESRTIMVEFVSPSRGVVGLRYSDFAISRFEQETEEQFLHRSQQELENDSP